VGRLIRASISAVACSAAFAASAAAAATVNVTTTVDDGATASAANCLPASCSLRDSVDYANANAGTTINVPIGVYALTGTELDITAPVTIVGHGASASGTEIVQQANSHARVLAITATTGSVSISGVELTGGNASYATPVSSPELGGGILIVPFGGGLAVNLTDVLVDHNTATGSSPTTPGAAGSDGDGGGIAVAPFPPSTAVNLSLSATQVIDNLAHAGDGATTAFGTAGSGGNASGGGVYYASSGSLSVSNNSSVTGNHATGGNGAAGAPGFNGGDGGHASGGGLLDSSTANDVLTLSGSKIDTNAATGGNGGNASAATNGLGASALAGGVGSASPVSLTNLEVHGNQAATGGDGTGGSPAGQSATVGGGLYLTGASNAIVRTTIDANSVSAPVGKQDYAAGADIAHAAVIENSTISGNQAPFAGGLHLDGATTFASDTIDGNGGGNVQAYALVAFNATIVADPVGGNNCGTGTGGSFIDLGSAGGNLEDDAAASCGFSAAAGDVVHASPMLGALAVNGGPTQTMLPAPGSAAIGKGGACIDPTVSPARPLTFDQRGLPRPSGGPCDIGSVQIQGPANTNAPQVLSASPTFPGRATFTCFPGKWSGDGTLSYSYSWSLDGKAIAGQAGSRFVSVRADYGHKLTCTVVARSTYGVTSPPATSAAVTVVNVALVMTKVSESHKTWRESGKRGKHKPPIGTTFKFTLLNSSARITLTFTQKTKSRKHHHKLKTVGKLKTGGVRGANSIKFKGKLTGGKQLKRGSYTITITATSSDGNAISGPLKFKIVR
jgi:CopC domain